MVMTMVAVLLTGCGAKGTEDGTETATVSGTETAKTETVEQEKTDLYVFLAASMKNAMDEIQKMYAEENPNVTLIYNSDSSGTLQTQIQEGAECDIFFSAATKQMSALDEGGFVESDTIKDLLKNEVVLIKPTDGETAVTGFEDISNAKNIALAGEDVPVGAYAREIFASLGILEKVMDMEINQGANVTAVLAAVSEQSNEIGIVYATDAESAADSVEVIATAPESLMKNPPVYPIGQIINEDASDGEKEAAKEFLDYLSSDEALQVFEKYGFAIYEE